MTDHQEQAEQLEREADEMRRRSKQVGEDIADAREDWAAKQRDDSVPGATGDPRDPEDEKPWPDE